jgi:hypothetical protein
MADQRCASTLRVHQLTVSGCWRWNVGGGEIKTPERTSAIGTRASANTSGPDFTWSRNPGEIADARIRTNEENLFLLPDRLLIENTIQPLT